MILINDVARLWWEWMINMFWQVSLFILIISAIDFVLQKWAWPQIRYALWLLVLLKLVIPPDWGLKTSVISQISPSIEQVSDYFPTSFKPVESTKPLLSSESTLNADLFPQSRGSQDPVESVQQSKMSPPLTWKAIAMLIWLTGLLSLFALLILKMLRLRRWHDLQKHHMIPGWFHELLVQTANQMSLSRLPAIVFHEKAVTPAVYGLFRPVMLLPANYFDELSRDEARHVLLHELAHLKRGDLWLHGFTLFMQIVYWFNPLILWARCQMKHVREICCDLTVANILRDQTPAYRQTLLNTARELLTQRVEPGLGLLGVFEEPFRLVTRLQWLERKTWEHRRKIAVVAALVCLAVSAVVLPMAGLSPEQSSEDSHQNGEPNYNVVADSSQSSIPSTAFADFNVKMSRGGSAVVLPKVGNSVELGDGAVQECRRLLKQQRIKPIGDPFGRYMSDPENVPQDEHVWEVGFWVKKPVKVKPPLELRHLPAMQVASLGAAGYNDTGPVWDGFIAHLTDQGYIPCFPPAFEIYRGEKYGKPMWQFTELQIPVFHQRSGYPGMELQFKETEPFTALVLPKRGSWSQIEDAYKQLFRYMKKKNIKAAGPPFGEFISDPTEILPENYEWLVGIPVDKVSSVDPPFEIRNFESTKVATTTCRGSMVTEFPWSPFIMMIIMEDMIPAGAAMEIRHRGLKTSDVELSIPVMESPISFSDMPSTEASEEDWEAWGEETGKRAQKWGQELADGIVTTLTGKSIDEINNGVPPAPSKLVEEIEANNTILQRALLDYDLDTYMRFVADDIIVNPPRRSEIHGKSAYRTGMEKEHQRGITYRTFESDVMECWSCDDYVYEISTFAMSLSLPENSKPVAFNGKSFSIWERMSDSSLVIVYSIYNTDHLP